jgi:hypothetical protein
MIAPRLMLLAGGLLLAGAANAECRLDTFQISNGQVFAQYDPFEATSTPTSVPLNSTGNSDCRNANVRITLAADPSTPFALDGAIRLRSGADVLEARLGDSNGHVTNSLFSSGTPSALLRFGTAGDVRQGDLRLVLPPGQRVPPGVYTARLIATAQVVDDNGDEGAPRSATFAISVTVRPIVGLAAGTDTTLNLGILRTGDTAENPVRFLAYANTGYRLRLSSDHDFAMTLNGRSNAPSIAYVPVLDRQDVGASNDVEFADPGFLGFRIHKLNVRVPQLDRRPAGVYRDYITVEISANVAG